MKAIFWILLTFTLFVATFGFKNCFMFVSIVFMFLFGFCTLMYIQEEERIDEMIRNFEISRLPGGCIRKIADLMKKAGRRKYSFSDRLTGSHVIDEEIQTILYYVFRDYIHPWYDQISDDQEFPYQLKDTIHQIIFNLANRVKQVDWTPYLTTQLVDDVATHLRLFKQARAKLKAANHGNLETYFFDLESSLEQGVVCRDHICMNSKEEKCYLQYLVEAFLFQVVPENDYSCKPIRFLAREILVEIVFYPFFTMISDPDYVNQTIIWLCKDFRVTSEIFLTVLKTTNNADELYATRAGVQREISALRSKEAQNDPDNFVRNRLRGVLYLERIIDERLTKLQGGSDRDSTGEPSSVDYTRLISSEQTLLQLPLDLILKNNVALSYLIDYMSSVGYQIYIFAYLNMEGWKISAKQEISKITSKNLSQETVKTFEQLKSAAQLLYEQYLSEKSARTLISDGSIIRSLYARINSESPQENWFDEVLQYLFNILQNDDKFLPGFYKHSSYVKLLAELELLKEPISKDGDEEEAISAEELVPSSTESSVGNSPIKIPNKIPVENASSVEEILSSNQTFTLTAKIIETGLVQESGKTFGIYAVAVTKLFHDGQSESWHVYRRYSDFYEFQSKVKEKFPDLGKIPFPGKKTFNNMEREVLEKRMKMLNNYLKVLLQLGVIKSHPALSNLLLTFLQADTDKAGPSDQFSKTFDNLFINPLKAVGQAVKTMPDNLLNTVDEVMGGFSRVFQKSSRNDEEEEMLKVSSVIDFESDNIPLRIMFLLMTEVFDLKTRNQWLRKRILQLLRQIIHAMFGDIVNRRIIEYVAEITSPTRIALCLAMIKNSVWPNGIRADTPLPRDNDIRMQTRVSAKSCLIASLSDELKHLLGSETCRAGLMIVFSMFQHQVLNKRLIYVFLEGFLVTLYPNLDNLIHKLHAESPRVLFSKQKKKAKKKE